MSLFLLRACTKSQVHIQFRCLRLSVVAFELLRRQRRSRTVLSSHKNERTCTKFIREHVLSSHTIQVSLSVVVAAMTKKIKRMKRDLEKQEAIFATHAHRVIRIDLKPRGNTGSPGPEGIIGNTGPLGEVGPRGPPPGFP